MLSVLARPTAGGPRVLSVEATRSLSVLPRLFNSAFSNDPNHSKSAVSSPPPPTLAARFVNALPPRWQPYARLARLDKSAGTSFLYIPCTWGLLYGSAPLTLSSLLPLSAQLATFLVGAVVMRGAGCTINDMWDRDFDRQVERTRDRPLASGELSMRQALGFLAGQLTVGLGVLLTLPVPAMVVGASSLPLVVLYPLMKRITYWPQLFLGLTFNWGVLLGYAAAASAEAAANPIAWTTVAPVYLSGICMTLVYDTIYAHQDKRDDVKAGVRSTALLMGDRTKTYLDRLALAQVALLAASGVINDDHLLFYLSLGLGYGLSRRLIRQVNLDDPRDCMRTFRRFTHVGALVSLASFAHAVF